MPIPAFVTRMHQSLLEELDGLAGKGGRSGRAARDFLEGFAPHIDREEADLLPALEFLSEAEASGMLPPAGAIAHLAPLLETGLARLEADHARLRRALAALRKVADDEGDLRLHDIVSRAAYLLAIEEERCFRAVVLKGAVMVGSLEVAEGRRPGSAASPTPGTASGIMIEEGRR